MAHLCGIAVQAFVYGDIPKGEGYDDYDLVNAITNCEDLLEAGYTKEPIDGFDLREFIVWAEGLLSGKGKTQTLSAMFD